jgi:hypothetical protein
MNASNFTAARTADRTTRTTATVSRSWINRAGEPKSVPAQIGETVRRFFNALMNSLATPHV